MCTVGHNTDSPKLKIIIKMASLVLVHDRCKPDYHVTDFTNLSVVVVKRTLAEEEVLPERRTKHQFSINM